MITELVCPDFYVDEWERLGRPRSKEDPGTEFAVAADDGVCRVMKTERDASGGTVLVCRCGMWFSAADAKQVPA